MLSDNKVTVYAVGGCGINIVTPLMKVAAKTDGYADLTFGMVDTSHSNLPEAGFENSFIHVGSRRELTDGSGKVRKTNAQAAKQAVSDILNRWEPGDLSVVVHSGSGGSGSVIGNVLVSELISRKKTVAVILVGSRTSVKEVDNTRDTILSYQKVAVANQRAVICHYLDNAARSMAENNDRARIMILFLSALWSGVNKGLDRKDLDNFVNYQDVSNYEPGVVIYDLFSGSMDNLDLGEDTAVSTVVSLIKPGEDPSPGIMVPYHSYGELAESMVGRMKIDTPIHLYTLQGAFPVILESLEKSVAAHRTPAKVATIDVSSVSDDDLII
jgi:hypothetical protein